MYWLVIYVVVSFVLLVLCKIPSWPEEEKSLKYFHLQISWGCSINVYATKKHLRFEFSRRRNAGSLFSNEGGGGEIG